MFKLFEAAWQYQIDKMNLEINYMKRVSSILFGTPDDDSDCSDDDSESCVPPPFFPPNAQCNCNNHMDWGTPTQHTAYNSPFCPGIHQCPYNSTACTSDNLDCPLNNSTCNQLDDNII